MNRDNSLLRARLTVCATAILAFGTCLFSRSWPRDDRWIILENPLIRAGWPAARALLLSGYVEPVLGAQTPIHEWRPLLSLSFLLQRMMTGFSPFPLHAVNLVLHVCVTLLVLDALRKSLDLRAATVATAFFSVLPIHAEVVAYISSRSELMSAVFILGAWLTLSAMQHLAPLRLLSGVALYLAGSLTKEHALLLPLLMGLSDWTFFGIVPWAKKRRVVYLALILSCCLILLGRALILPDIAHGGIAYFSNTHWLSKLLTVSKFWIWFYLRSAILGVGLCTDFSRPLINDAPLTDPSAWISLSSLLTIFVSGTYAVYKRKIWGFWVIGPCIFLLPTSHLIIDLDTLGAQRLLYLPSLSIAFAFGAVYSSLEKRRHHLGLVALAAPFIWLGARAIDRTRAWLSDIDYYQAECEGYTERGEVE
jgi:hypothetical protein